MPSVKEKIIQEIQNMNDEDLLKEVYTVFQDIEAVKQKIILNKEQISNIQEAREDYKKGRFHSTDDLFKDLIND